MPRSSFPFRSCGTMSQKRQPSPSFQKWQWRYGKTLSRCGRALTTYFIGSPERVVFA
jgi:hypothetical protein